MSDEEMLQHYGILGMNGEFVGHQHSLQERMGELVKRKVLMK